MVACVIIGRRSSFPLLRIPEGVILDEPCVFLSWGQGRAGLWWPVLLLAGGHHFRSWGFQRL